VLNVRGKRAKDRVVPTSDRLEEALIIWQFFVGPEGKVLRSLGRNKIPGDSISTIALYNIVQKRGVMIGKPALQPHDLRRTYAELGRRADVSIEQIMLGHATIKTTQDYSSIQLDLETTISDFVPF
jgi:site-specific recombinase XerD